MHSLEITEGCEREIRKLTAKNKTLSEALKKKLAQILENPERFKPLGNVLKGMRRVHIDSCFVLIYEIDGEIVRLVRFAHHDAAYK